MHALMEVVSVIIAIIVIAYHVRPVTLAEKARLLDLAEGDKDCEQLVDRIVERKWLTVAECEQIEKSIADIKSRRRREQRVAEAFANKAIRDTKRKRL